MRLLNKVFLNAIGLICILTLFYYCFLTDTVTNGKHLWFNNEHSKNVNVFTTVRNEFAKDNINIWCIFTKVTENAPLQAKFRNLVKSLFTFNSVPLHIHVISDKTSKVIATKVLDEYKNISKEIVIYSFYDVKFCAKQINDIVQTMMPHFSSQPGTYYSDALFYLSLGLHRIASKSQTRAIMLDCDVQFTTDVSLLYKEFDRFTPSTLFGLAHELTPVYRHVLYSYRNHRNTSFGEYVHDKPISTSGVYPYGFPGFNSGVMLFNFSAIRESKLYPIIIGKDNVERLVMKYKFKGHLGDQDFYTLLGYEYPELFRILPCNFNRQLCIWWRDHGYSDLFSKYFKCEGDIIIYHGNCNTPIPLERSKR